MSLFSTGHFPADLRPSLFLTPLGSSQSLYSGHSGDVLNGPISFRGEGNEILRVTLVLETDHGTVNFQLVGEFHVAQGTDDLRTLEDLIPVIIMSRSPINEQVAAFPGIGVIVVHRPEKFIHDLIGKSGKGQETKSPLNLSFRRGAEGVVIAFGTDGSYAVLHRFRVCQSSPANTTVSGGDPSHKSVRIRTGVEG